MAHSVSVLQSVRHSLPSPVHPPSVEGNDSDRHRSPDPQSPSSVHDTPWSPELPGPHATRTTRTATASEAVRCIAATATANAVKGRLRGETPIRQAVVTQSPPPRRETLRAFDQALRFLAVVDQDRHDVPIAG